MTAEQESIPRPRSPGRAPGAARRSRPWSRPGARRRGRSGSQLAVSGEGEMVGSVSAAASRARWWPRRWTRSATGAAAARLRRVGRRCLRGRPRLRRTHPRDGGAGRRGRGSRSPCSSGWWRPGRGVTAVVCAVRPGDWQRRLVDGPGDPCGPQAEAALRPTGRGSPASGFSASTTRRCGWRWSGRCTSPRRWCRWRGSPATT